MFDIKQMTNDRLALGFQVSCVNHNIKKIADVQCIL